MHHQRNRSVKVFVSLGLESRWPRKRETGTYDKDAGPTIFVRSRNELGDLVELMEAQIDKVAEQNPEFKYYRMSAGLDYDTTKIEEWRHFALFRAQKAVAASEQQRKAAMEKCAAVLVEQRRVRARTLRWESFALGTRYRCPEEGCPFSRGRSKKPFSDRDELLNHLELCHGYAPPNPGNAEILRQLLHVGRTNSD